MQPKEMDFSRALGVLMNDNMPISRIHWNDPGANQGLRVCLKAGGGADMTEEYLYLEDTIKGTMIPWLPSQEDILAKNWTIFGTV